MMLIAFEFSPNYTPSMKYLLFAIFFSMIGAFVGHLKSNGSIQMPLLMIDYKRKREHKNVSPFKNPLRFSRIVFEFFLFLIGIRYGRNKRNDPLNLELGVFGDLIVGIATGALAFAAVGMSGANNTYVLITASVLAGYGGFSYIEKLQIDNMNKEDQHNYKVEAEAPDNVDMKEYTSSIQEVAPSKQLDQ
ncbi:hypothetical protein MOB77_12545 [Bacillus haynesii]|uniref:hypothetical protein n=1 Tax=Bacillus haynesii TaxID=1925021 RepID=UPI0022810F32|nr:hypothetical protein [Bacillus haynesii]MCY8067819.1 hypothetical protein [Bacillus haynesii]MEC0752376.1 hypothetical protein [Bacillus haynesii]